MTTILRGKYTGPYIGILTSDGGSPFQGNHHNFADIIRMGRKMGIAVFVVTPKSFQTNDSTVLAYILDPNSKKIRWHQAVLPFPQALYNRIPSRKAEQKTAVKEFMLKVQDLQIPIFNPHFFNKWQLYKHLEKSPILKHVVPESVKLSTPISLQKMILRHSVIYLKPIDGKAGIGMMRVTHLNDEFQLIYQSATQKGKHTFTRFSDLWKKVIALKKDTPYVIQQGIALAKYQGSPFDLRMLLQKDSQGIWKLTGIGIRVAGNTAISTHVPQGGRIELANKVLSEVFAHSKEEIMNYAKKIGLKTAQYIESQGSGLLGEMSIDWGIDDDGDLWFFEANAKPMKFDEPDIRTLSLRRIIQYGVYLSGYHKEVERNEASKVYS